MGRQTVFVHIPRTGRIMGRLAFSHPGKLGDALYTLPTIKEICRLREAKCDFYTSPYCRPLLRLFEFQKEVNRVYFPDNYVIENMSIGVQPYYMPIDTSLYETVWQLGFRSVPTCALPNFIAATAGIQNSANIQVSYEYPDIPTLDEPYIVLAARGRTTFEPVFKEVVEKCPIKVVQVGGFGDEISTNGNSISITGLDMLETTTWIAKSVGFIGIMSAMLVIANGFDIPKVAPHNGKSWDMRHVVTGPNNMYPVLPTAEEMLALVGLKP